MMTSVDTPLAFSLAATLLTLTPGMDTALVLCTATVEGRRQAVRAALGINVGCLLWGAAVAFGLGALIAVSELAYSILKYCGAAWLCWLGLTMLLRPRCAIADNAPDGAPATNWFVKGMFGNLLNPKIGIFYVSLLPQFIPHGQPLIVWSFGPVAIHALVADANWRHAAAGEVTAPRVGHPQYESHHRRTVCAVCRTSGAE